MELPDELVESLGVAFNEADVLGFQYDDRARSARLFIETLALPESGPVEPDLRRVVHFRGVSSAEFRLWTDSGQPARPLPLTSLEEVEALFANTTVVGAMYGWDFINIKQPTASCRAEPALTLGPRPRRTGHSFDWFAALNRPRTGNDVEPVVLDGTIYFDELAIERADGTPIPLEVFAQDGCRWWQAFRAHDERVGFEAQRVANAASPRCTRPSRW